MTIFIITNTILAFVIFYCVKTSRFIGKTAFEVSLKIAVVTTLTNLIGSLVLGFTLVFKVMYETGDGAWWFMPLIVAPIEYWFLFGLPILGYYLVIAISTWYYFHYE